MKSRPALRETQFQHLFDHSHEGIFLMALDRPVPWNTASDAEKDILLEHAFDQLRLTEINGAMCRQLGAPREALLGLSARQRWDHDFEAWRERMRRLCDDGHIHFSGASHRHDGTAYLTEGDYICLCDAEGYLSGYFGVQRDVTDREGAAEALRQSQERLELALDAGQLAVWDWNPQTRQAFCDPRIAAMLGFEPDELAAILERGGWHDELVHPSDRALHQQVQGDHLAGRTPLYHHEFRVRRADGGYIWLSARGRVTQRDPQGRALRLVGVAHDVSNRRAMEKRLRLAESLASLGTLAASVAHEINNPLAFVLGNLEVLDRRLSRARDGLDPSEIVDLGAMARDAVKGAMRVRDIVRHLRTMARGEQAESGSVDLEAVLDLAVHMTRNQVSQRACLVRRHGPAVRVRGDQTRLGQVFVNLLVNAVQSIPTGAPDRHQIDLATRAAGPGRAVVEVRDTGAGMEPDVLARIFDPFFTTKQVGGGMGLGLSICHSIVSELGGEIRVDSSPGGGTRFEVELPVEVGPPAEVAPPASPIPAAAPTPPASGAVVEPEAAPHAPRRILVVDDEPLAGQVLTRLLEGHQVVSETRADAALSRIRAGERFDRVLCDIMMPGMSGRALYTELPEDVRERVVFMTGGAFTAEAAEFLASVPNPRLDKPFELDDLEAVLGFRLT